MGHRSHPISTVPSSNSYSRACVDPPRRTGKRGDAVLPAATARKRRSINMVVDLFQPTLFQFPIESDDEYTDDDASDVSDDGGAENGNTQSGGSRAASEKSIASGTVSCDAYDTIVGQACQHKINPDS